jgi:hypothetical protein
MRGSKSHRTVISHRGQRADLTIRRHVDSQPKSRRKTSPTARRNRLVPSRGPKKGNYNHCL